MQVTFDEMLWDKVGAANVRSPVLVKDEHIEPGAGLLFWLIHLDPDLSEQPVQSLVLDGTHAIDGHSSNALGQ